jgi:hypothetical protein
MKTSVRALRGLTDAHRDAVLVTMLAAAVGAHRGAPAPVDGGDAEVQLPPSVVG